MDSWSWSGAFGNIAHGAVWGGIAAGLGAGIGLWTSGSSIGIFGTANMLETLLKYVGYSTASMATSSIQQLVTTGSVDSNKVMLAGAVGLLATHVGTAGLKGAKQELADLLINSVKELINS